MAISRVSTSYQTASSTTSTSATISAYNPNFTGNERSRIILIAHRSAAAGGGAIGSMTYGGRNMTAINNGYSFINNGVQSHGFFYVINPPTGAQDIVITTISSINWSVKIVICAYGSNTDSGFFITNATTNNTLGTSLTTTLNSSANISWSLSMTSCSAQLQTLTTGSFLDGDANPGNLMVSDSGSEISVGTSTGIGCTIPSSSSIFQDVVCFAPIRRGLMYFFT